MWVRTRPGWPGDFKRSVRDPKTKAILKTLVFNADVVEVTDPAELEAIARDVGHALEEMKPVDGRTIPKFIGVNDPPPGPPAEPDKIRTLETARAETEAKAQADKGDAPKGETANAVADPVAEAVAANAKTVKGGKK